MLQVLECVDSYLLLIVELVRFDLLNLFVYSESTNKQTEILPFICPRHKLRCHNIHTP